MGCGGSRADAIEPRYYESWTRETESTWLTYTDSDTPPSAAAPDSGPEAGGLHADILPNGKDGVSVLPFCLPGLERGLAPQGDAINTQDGTSCSPRPAFPRRRPLLFSTTGAQWLVKLQITCPPEGGVLEDGLSSNGVPRSTAQGGISNPEKKTSCGTQCSNPQSLSSGTLTQKHNGLRTTEAKRDAKRMPAKEVTISVTEQHPTGGGSRGITENCAH
ncbi:hypothetical protein QTO34_007639 [Cnephaeus nilssonii]|uniref:Brain and acute leukemia cytoplasmic protein n=1 Tax=Cnephaeus nilssonii TaxID=3371016 RepID=A0AA40HJD9_CNENI|nr:hypothetical protein QTO34_007639 [Eptesicus nilssonii]